MSNNTNLFTMIYGWWIQLNNSVEYYFAKKWLDKTFGEQEYWGDYIWELIQKQDNKS